MPSPGLRHHEGTTGDQGRMDGILILFCLLRRTVSWAWGRTFPRNREEGDLSIGFHHGTQSHRHLIHNCVEMGYYPLLWRSVDIQDTMELVGIGSGSGGCLKGLPYHAWIKMLAEKTHIGLSRRESYENRPRYDATKSARALES
ncbi:hypothetical protein N7457_001570 [Penicillium paradoxum]|uniref:uncharacterized protein n=1 Tax=Penicillium paradoxum TaxID=176176 RepID=UPI002548F389|nr:uncharacterized protein N7457_001570 [Penicillium paradoxum]KAJ5794971.1 hypothetical protein N7457_001570 [Penicillium paradoxum]